MKLTQKQKAIARDNLSSWIEICISDDITDKPEILKDIWQYAMGIYDYTQDPKEVLSEIADEERKNLYQDIQLWWYWYNAMKEDMEK